MPVFGIERKSVTLSLPAAAYRSLQRLAEKEGMTVPGFVRGMIVRRLLEEGLPLYSGAESGEKEEEHSGQG